MKAITLPLVLATALAAPLSATAQDGLGNVLGDVARNMLAQEVDRNSFNHARQQNTVAAYENYLRNFPQGAFRQDAMQAIRTFRQPQVQPVQPSVMTPAAIEAQLRLTTAQRREVQTQLTALGYNTRGADGVWGKNTRAALRDWQSANRRPVTGYMVADEMALLARQWAALPKAPVQTRPTPLPGSGDEASERALGLSVSERREVQLRLTLLGHDTEGTAGTFDTRTRRALRAWQRSQGAAETGYLTEDQLKALQRQTRG